MSRQSKRKHHFTSRAIFLKYIPILAVILIDVFFLALLDTLFVKTKRERILDSKNEFNEMLQPIDPLKKRLAGMLPSSPTESQYENYFEKAKRYLDEQAPKIIAGDHPWFWIVLTDLDNDVIASYRNETKLHEYNTWNNCLFSRSFYARVGQLDIKLDVYYTTPQGWEVIESMVDRYRMYALFFVAISWLVYFWLHRKVFRPLLQVGTAIERMIHSEKVYLIPKPGHEIEDAFNRLARNQRAVYFGFEIDRLVDSLHTLSDDNEVTQQFLYNVSNPISRIYPFVHIETFQYISEENRLVQLNGEPNHSIEIPVPLNEDQSIQIETQNNIVLIYLYAGEQIIGALRCSPIKESVPHDDEIYLMAREIKRQTENGLARAFTRSRALTEERNRFGINLATNMGHDLTNIIASGKWDLDTIQRSQNMGFVKMDSQKGHFFTDAVNGLRNNLYFLQEMVDIYRSFGYTQRPRYEKADLSDLVQDVAELFRLSTSQNLALHVSTSESIEVLAEPRLLRMALFNLLANASQAIQKSDDPIRDGKIEVELNENHNRINLSIRDNGPGIRDDEGNLLPETEVNRIFHSGYSTKKGTSGGGLGLSWVKSIVEDFHEGSIRAFNRSEGGACISITLPLFHPE